MTKQGLTNQGIPPATIQGDVNIQQPVDVEVVNAAPIDVDVVSIPDPFTVTLSQQNNLDAFQRLRVSDTGHRVDTVFTYDKQPLLFDEVISGTGSATHDGNIRAVYLSTGGLLNGAYAGLRLHYYTPYTPGNSQLIFITGTLNPDATVDWTNARAEIGYGDLLNGVGFRFDENGASIFLRSSISGAAVDLVNVLQAAWNVDTAGTVDWSKSQIFGIDFQSLAIGRIRFYLDREGEAVLVHEIFNDNLRVGPYWQNASLPPYWSVENTGAANSVCRMLAVCSTVKSEGGDTLENLRGFPFSVDTVASPKTVSTTLVPVLSIQIKGTFGGHVNRGIVIPTVIEAMGTNPVLFRVYRNPTLTGAVFASVDPNSLCNYDVAATVIGGGTRIASGFVTGGGGGGRGAGDVSLTGKIPLSLNALGTIGDILTVAAIRVGTSNSDLSVAINWQEIR